MTNAQKQLAFRLKTEGLSLAEIGRQVGCSAPMIGLMVRAGKFRTGLPDEWQPRRGRLTIFDRERILLGLG
ncbi:MAG: IS30 family transposase, partial [Candidatus Dormibacteria bacterium]